MYPNPAIGVPIISYLPQVPPSLIAAMCIAIIIISNPFFVTGSPAAYIHGAGGWGFRIYKLPKANNKHLIQHAKLLLLERRHVMAYSLYTTCDRILLHSLESVVSHSDVEGRKEVKAITDIRKVRRGLGVEEEE
jgi:hypothetical protein